MHLHVHVHVQHTQVRVFQRQKQNYFFSQRGAEGMWQMLVLRDKDFSMMIVTGVPRPYVHVQPL